VVSHRLMEEQGLMEHFLLPSALDKRLTTSTLGDFILCLTGA